MKKLITKLKLFILNKNKKHVHKLIYNYTQLTPINSYSEQDVFIVGFPKSGNTLMQNIMTGIVYGINPKQLHDTVIQELIPDVHPKIYYKRFLDRCFFKSHDLPKPEFRNVIYIVRDGRDAMVSYYHYNKALGDYNSMEDMIYEGKGLINSKWHIHTQQWVNNPYSANIMFLKYEDLLRNPLESYNRICDFVNIKRDQAFLEELIEGCSFSNMRKKEEEQGWADRWKPKNGFVRKGKIGDYVNELNEETIKYFTNESYQMLKHFNYI